MILKENLGVRSLVYEYGHEFQKEYGALLSSTTGSRVWCVDTVRILVREDSSSCLFLASASSRLLKSVL